MKQPLLTAEVSLVCLSLLVACNREVGQHEEVEVQATRQAVEPTASVPNDLPAGTVPFSTAAPAAPPRPPSPPADLRPRHLEVIPHPDHFVLAGPGKFDGVSLIPNGVAASYAGNVWVADSETREVVKIETAETAYSLVSDGKWLYWLGAEKRGALNLSTLELGFFNGFAPRHLERDLAMGEVLYGLRTEGWVYRLGKGPMRTANIGKAEWTTPLRLQAGDHVVAFAVIERNKDDELEHFVWRRELNKVVRGQAQRIDYNPGGWRSWSMDHSGALLFFRDGQVMRQGRKAKKATVLFAQGDLSTLCWCGPHVCGVENERDQLRLHRRGKPESTSIAEGVGDAWYLRCDAKRVAWVRTGAEETSEVHVVPLRPSPARTSSRG